ncbi:hypothetical protein ACQPZF_12775 [Actinosynnema sp. CS-041913]|uniref:hypothetical protein n=1 Tax=Actinosynnema sp. CS-041913 TaxID=3239917 RepID=UPI003D94614D
MDRTRLGTWLMIVLATCQALAALLTSPAVEPTVIAVALNAAAVASATWLLRHPDHNRWPLTAWAAGFFGWHATGLVTLAGLVTTGIDALFVTAPQPELSTLYQATLAVAAAFAVHLLLPRPSRS